MVCARLSKTLLAGAVAGVLATASTNPLEARPLPVTTAATIAGDAPVDQVGWRRHHWGGYGYRHYGWRRHHGGAAIAGAALGLIGLAAAASIANSGYYGGYPYHGYGYAPVYYRSAYAYPRVRVVRVVRHYPSYYPYYRRVHYRPYWGYRRAYWRRHHWY